MPQKVMVRKQDVDACKCKLMACICMGSGCGLCIGAAVLSEPCPLALLGTILFVVGACQKVEETNEFIEVTTFTPEEWASCKDSVTRACFLGGGLGLCITGAFVESCAGPLAVFGTALCCAALCLENKKKPEVNNTIDSQHSINSGRMRSSYNTFDPQPPMMR